jgi:hypothetical protein
MRGMWHTKQRTEMHVKFWLENQKEKCRVDDLGTEWRKILLWILHK